MIDTHVHLDAPIVYQITEQERFQILEHTPRAFLYSGVTTVLDLSPYVSGEPGEILANRTAQRAGRLLSPRIYTVGLAFTPKNGWGPEGESALTNADEARTRARRYAADGVDGFKIMVEDDVLDPGPLREKLDQMVGAVAEEARRAHLPVYAHAVNLREYRRALELRPRAIVHGLEDEITDDDALIGEIVRTGTYIVPTLSLFESFNRFEGSRTWFEDAILKASVPLLLAREDARPQLHLGGTMAIFGRRLSEDHPGAKRPLRMGSEEAPGAERKRDENAPSRRQARGRHGCRRTSGLQFPRLSDAPRGGVVG